MKNQYPYSAYNKYLCLKFSIPMWLVSLFLVRPFAILIMSVAKKGERTALLESIYGGNIGTMVLETIAALPALLILIMLAKREPLAPAFVRSIWSRGRTLLLFATFLNIGSFFMPIFWQSALRFNTADIIKLVICALILVFLLTSQRVKDTFNDFPQEDQEKKKL